MKIKNPYEVHKKNYQKFTQPSKFIPDQTMSIPELIRRYASGLPLGAGIRTPMFDEEPERDPLMGRPLASYDLSEQQTILHNVKNEYNEVVEKVRKSRTKQTPPTDQQQGDAH